MRSLFFRTLVILSILISFSSGCQYFKSAIFTNLDSLVLMQMEEYFDLTDQQIELLRPKVISHLKWAQQHVITQLITELEHLKNQQKPIGNQQFLFIQQKIGKIWYSIIDRIADDCAWLFINLSPQQLKYLQKQLLDKHQERYKPAFSSKTEFPEQFAEYQQTMLEGFEKLIGDLSEKQTVKIFQLTRKNQQNLRSDSNIITQNRIQFFQKVSALKKPKQLAIFFRQWAHYPSEDYQKFRLKRNQKTLQILSTLETNLTKKQIEFRQAKIDDVLTDLKMIRKVIF